MAIRSTLRVAVLDDYQHVALGMADWSVLPAGSDLVVFTDHVEGLDALAERLRDFDVVVAMRERSAFPRQLLEQLRRLRLLVTTGMGNAVIDLAAATELGVTVCGTGGTGTPTAELTWGLILALLRHIPTEDANIRNGRWQATVGTDLAGQTLAVLGLGRLGSQVARVGAAFRMEVVAWSPNLTEERAAKRGARLVTCDELFAGADVLTIHLVLSERTRGLVGEKELGAMKPTAVIINTSRGPIIDEQALVHALQNGTIAGAALDVFDREPLPAGHPLRVVPNTVLTPHIGYVTAGCYNVFYREIVEDIVAFAAGEPVRVLNPAVSG